MLRRPPGRPGPSRDEHGTALHPPSPEPARTASRDEHGTVLLLFVAAAFAVLALAAIVLDAGFARVRAQELRAVAASAANDALGALNADALRSTGTVSFDDAEARRLVRAAVAAGPVPHADVESVAITRQAAERWEIAVRLAADIDFVIAPALPGSPRRVRVAVTERALAVVSSD